MPRPRRAIVLSGGGAKGAFQIGVLEVLILEARRDYDVFCGVSVGSLHAAYLAQAEVPHPPDDAKSLENLGRAFAQLRGIWLERIGGNASVYRRRFAGVAGVLGGADSVYDPRPLRELLAATLRPERLRRSGRALRIQHVSLETGELRTVSQDDPRVVDYVLASSSMPFLFPPVEVDGEHLVDGGLRDITPLGLAFRAEPPPEEIDVLLASPFEVAPAEFRDNFLGTARNAFHILGRTVEILTNEIYRNDVEGAETLNALKAGWEAARHSVADAAARDTIDAVLRRVRVARLRRFVPEREAVANALDFSPSGIRANYEHGKEVARRVLASP
jgi:NTE family protein